MYSINWNELDEQTQKDFIKLLKNYYSGLIYDDESLKKYVENIKNERVVDRTKRIVKVKKIDFNE